MEILVPAIPARLRITQTMICDFVSNPIHVCEYVFKDKLDAFQRVRLKICHWTPRVMDSSGFSSTKTRGFWWISNIRPILFEGHVSGIYYPNWEQGKRIYWPYFREIALKSDIYRAHCGRDVIIGIDGKTAADAKAMDKGPSCSVFNYKNGSMVMMPAPNFLQGAKSSAGFRFNDLYIDEWTKVEAIPGKGEGIDDQLVGRTTKACYNKNHPVFCNHHLFCATAEDTMHPAHERYRIYCNEVKSGNPEYAVISWSFKDYSDLPFDENQSFKDKFREDRAVHDLRKKGRAGYLQEALGIWSKNGRGWYTSEMLDTCRALGESTNADFYCSRAEDPEGEKAKYFLGIDPSRGESKKADDGALVVLRAVPLLTDYSQDQRAWKLSFCYAYKVRQADATQWSGIIHRKHLHFGFTGMMMDPGGGGIWIQPELRKEQQIIRNIATNVRPIGTIEDEEGMMVMGDFILAMFRPKDARVQQAYGHMTMLKQENLTDVGHEEFREALSLGIAFPPNMRQRGGEAVKTWSAEKRYAAVLVSDPKHGIAAQLLQIFVATDEQGHVQRTKGSNARRFSSKKDKDFAYAAMMAYMRFKIWMAGGAEELEVSEDDAAMCGGDRSE